ncbi:MAG: glycogen synthase GlgA [Bosea sp.]|uniref:glycogen synthase GlgA n=1 Tax=Bosea sp. (in: a-proteobacteria) TaxID=1871050 RepID=UPI001AD5A6E0|nr:glycogen synthase GlgA [Bosea sp. (in: a-proteobacteria)]MBN9451606.1 glycogen synthase GlgA [Bosea sp. (in: a-proteobacteria)]
MTNVLELAEIAGAPATSGHALHYAPAVKDDIADQPSPIAATTKLLFVTSEMGDFIKAGGLGEVSTALPRQLRKFCEVRVLLPGFRQVRKAKPAMDVVRQMPRVAGLPPWSLGRFTTSDGLIVYTVLCDELYDRDGSPYGPFGGGDFGDNDVRFGRLSLAAAEIAAGEADPNWKPDVVHVNDWPSALAPGYMRWKGLETPSILTIHNLAYQGLYHPQRMRLLGIPDQAFNINGSEFHGKISFLKSGIFYGSHVTTVSETYANEITTAEHGCGLDGLLKTRMGEGRLTGIVNGIDDSWNALIEGGRSGDQIIRQWKRRNAADIRRTFDLPESRGPLFSIVSRLVHQKGIDLSLEAAETIVAQGGQLVVTGRGEPRIEEAVEKLARRYPRAVAARIGFDDGEARRLFAASDFLLMPSRFEPCGLSQMYAQRSGALPIAYRTGGLVDTIEDGLSGFLFSNLTGAGLTGAVARALEAFRSKRTFRQMRDHAMAKRFDWRRPSFRYADVYARALAA